MVSHWHCSENIISWSFRIQLHRIAGGRGCSPGVLKIEAVGGDWLCINSENELEQVILYASEAQDRKARDSQ
ncbi:hypothetical protein [Gimesia algae]|uniref:Uncharacterized protein n=1 Tax=Gimesia algae TaxID=2527971 RepID=A0A517VCR7_9PLAN|nr:hypothetical protein [Gimesia algae]QDT90805.1 hypothetical protein Pan161_24590 [Gimesia algae]